MKFKIVSKIPDELLLSKQLVKFTMEITIFYSRDFMLITDALPAT